MIVYPRRRRQTEPDYLLFQEPTNLYIIGFHITIQIDYVIKLESKALANARYFI